MGTRTFRGRHTYDLSFKLAVIEEYLSGTLSFRDFCKKSHCIVLPFTIGLLPLHLMVI